MGTAAGRWVLAATVLGSGMALIDATVVNVALERIGTDFDADFSRLVRLGHRAPGDSCLTSTHTAKRPVPPRTPPGTIGEPKLLETGLLCAPVFSYAP
jgi:hypothetical protein